MLHLFLKQSFLYFGNACACLVPFILYWHVSHAWLVSVRTDAQKLSTGTIPLYYTVVLYHCTIPLSLAQHK